MGTINIGGQWDETICNMIACQHPPCWESMRRIESGHPHILLKNVVIPGRDFPASEDKLPTLKVVDLPLHYPRRERVKCVGGLDSSYKTISSSKEARNCSSNSILNGSWIPPISVLSSERNPFPGLNSRMESQSLHFPPITFTSLRQPEKMQVTNLSGFVVQRLGSQPACESTVIQWVPDMRPRFLHSENPNRRVKAPPQRICVKDLALESLLSLKDHQGTKRKKSNKVPTGGQPYFRHLRRNQKSNKSSSVGQQRNPDDSLLRTRKHPVPALHLLLHNEEGMKPQESKRGRALLETKEKLAAPFIVQKAPSFDRSEAKIPMKDKDSGRSLGRQPKIVSGESLVLRRLMVEQLGDAGNYQDKKGGGLLEHSQMAPEPAAIPLLPAFRKPSSGTGSIASIWQAGRRPRRLRGMLQTSAGRLGPKRKHPRPLLRCSPQGPLLPLPLPPSLRTALILLLASLESKRGGEGVTGWVISSQLQGW